MAMFPHQRMPQHVRLTLNGAASRWSRAHHWPMTEIQVNPFWIQEPRLNSWLTSFSQFEEAEPIFCIYVRGMIGLDFGQTAAYPQWDDLGGINLSRNFSPCTSVRLVGLSPGFLLSFAWLLLSPWNHGHRLQYKKRGDITNPNLPHWAITLTINSE